MSGWLYTLFFEEIYSWKEEQLLFIVRSLACKVELFFFPPCKPFKSIPHYAHPPVSFRISLLDSFPPLNKFACQFLSCLFIGFSAA